MIATSTYNPISPLIIAGPPAVGKTTIALQLQKHYLCELVLLTTTRPPSLHDLKHQDYNYLDNELFQLYENQSRFTYYYHYGKYKYALEKNTVDTISHHNKVPLIEIPTIKVPAFFNLYPNAQAIFLLPDPFELLQHHMQARGDTLQTQSELLELALKEIETYNDIQKNLFTECYIVTNDNTIELVHDIGRRFLNHT